MLTTSVPDARFLVHERAHRLRSEAPADSVVTATPVRGRALADALRRLADRLDPTPPAPVSAHRA